MALRKGWAAPRAAAPVFIALVVACGAPAKFLDASPANRCPKLASCWPPCWPNTSGRNACGPTAPIAGAVIGAAAVRLDAPGAARAVGNAGAVTESAGAEVAAGLAIAAKSKPGVRLNAAGAAAFTPVAAAPPTVPGTVAAAGAAAAPVSAEPAAPALAPPMPRPAPRAEPPNAPRPAIRPFSRLPVAIPVPPPTTAAVSMGGMPKKVPATPRMVGSMSSRKPASGRPVIGLVVSEPPFICASCCRPLTSPGVTCMSMVSLPRPYWDIWLACGAAGYGGWTCGCCGMPIGLELAPIGDIPIPCGLGCGCIDCICCGGGGNMAGSLRVRLHSHCKIYTNNSGGGSRHIRGNPYRNSFQTNQRV